MAGTVLARQLGSAQQLLLLLLLIVANAWRLLSWTQRGQVVNGLVVYLATAAIGPVVDVVAQDTVPLLLGRRGECVVGC